MIKCCALFLLLAASGVGSNMIHSCDERGMPMSYLNVAGDMIEKAKNNFPICENNTTRKSGKPRKSVDCADILQRGHRISGVYTISPMNRLTEDKLINVYCDMETNGGGWTLIQRRGDYDRPKDFFFEEWKNYKEGFGDIRKDFWLGNDNIFALTNQRLYSARFDLEDVGNSKSYAQYDTFWIDDENNKYTLHISDYSGTAGDSMIPEQNNQKFTTKDQDNDKSKEKNCANQFKGAWWYMHCHQSNLNGLYHKGKHDSFADGVNWFTWKGYHDSLLKTEIKVRPKNFRQPSPDSTPKKK